MTKPDLNNVESFETPKELYNWLEENYNSSEELWIRIFKKDSKIPSVTWKEVVVEVLCWGWIDGIKKSFDEVSYIQRITPRRAKSSWSKINRSHVESLIAQNRMKEPGLYQVRLAKEDGRWDAAYKTSEMEVPSDFIAALDSNPSAKEFFETLNKSNRFVIAHGLLSAKRAETRLKRFNKYLEQLENRIKPN